jgi:hypothetical protein
VLTNADAGDAQAVGGFIASSDVGRKVVAGRTWLCCTEAIFEATNDAYRGVCTQGLGQTLPGAAMKVQTLQTRRQGFSQRE